MGLQRGEGMGLERTEGKGGQGTGERAGDGRYETGERGKKGLERGERGGGLLHLPIARARRLRGLTGGLCPFGEWLVVRQVAAVAGHDPCVAVVGDHHGIGFHGRLLPLAEDGHLR